MIVRRDDVVKFYNAGWKVEEIAQVFDLYEREVT